MEVTWRLTVPVTTLTEEYKSGTSLAIIMTGEHPQQDTDVLADPMAVLHEQLLAAHRCGNADRLTLLYASAADFEESCGNIDAMCFFLTQACVHALQAGHPSYHSLHARLAKHGRI